MNAEYLLDAIGQLDDDLVQEAERYRRPKARYGRFMGLAASFAVVIALGYVLTHLGMGGGAPGFSGGNGMAPANGGGASPGGYTGASSAVNGEGAPLEPDAAGDSLPNGSWSAGSSAVGAETPGDSPASGDPQETSRGTIFVRGDRGGGVYVLSGEVLAEKPEEVELELLGNLLTLGLESPWLSTDVEEYVGLNLWAENDGSDLPPTVYVELPAGGFAVAELVQP